MKLFLITIIIFLITSTTNAQSYNNNWYFGDNAGITFNTSSPTALVNGQLLTQEGCAAISDDLGNLLFYTDGTKIYNRNHVIMPNGNGLWGNLSSSQSAVIVPQPNSNRYYYVFTLDAFAGAHGFSYSVVDIQADGGLGDVTIKNVQVLTPAAEKITVVKHANNHDFWIVIHGWNNNTFHSYLLTNTGFNTTPISTSIGMVYSGGGGLNNAANAIGYMKVSSDGTMIALAVSMSDVYELFHFNTTTGVLSDLITIGDPDNIASTSYPYGVEFSPNSEYLYLKNMYSQNVYQFSLSTFTQPAITASKQLVGTVSGTYYYYSGAMQLGPDNMIYIAQEGISSLARIMYPNNPAASCGLVDNAIPLAGRICRLGLPCMVLHTFYNNPYPTIESDGCFLGPINFWLDDTIGITSVIWDFGDPLSGNNSSVDFEPQHVFSSQDTYTITLIYTDIGGTIDTITSICSINDAPNVINNDSIGLCNGVPSIANAENGFDSYLWSNGSNSQSINISSTGVYSITATINGCEVYDSITALFHNIDDLDIGNDTIICNGDTLTIGTNLINYSHEWNTGSTNQNISVSQTGTYILTISQMGCSDSDTLNVEVENIIFDLGSSQTLCASPIISIMPVGNYTSILWEDGSSNVPFDISIPGVYLATAFFGPCSTTDSIEIFPCSVIWFPNVFTPNGDMHNPAFLAVGVNIGDFHMLIFNRWGQIIFESDDINAGWDGTFKGRECPEGVYFYIADYTLWTIIGQTLQESKGSVTLFR